MSKEEYENLDKLRSQASDDLSTSDLIGHLWDLMVGLESSPAVAGLAVEILPEYLRVTVRRLKELEEGLPQLEDVQLLWSCGHYDGPASGIAKYQDQYYWFNTPEIDRHPRQFVLHPITLAEFQVESQRQQIWRETFGSHCDFKDNRRLVGPSLDPSPEAAQQARDAMDRIRNHSKISDYLNRNPIGYYQR